ncbi:uncharacterized protein LOC106096408 [Stomoxys calcitrans]|uniref:uncharacterized protein LOC106096408 n=1 Tax=Stomoxys calcitrans TaxID=35570 RepID=UPI0027E2C861|nr:uncharacterized protein LOC106096408 [Stomoxys calcitrans]
MLQLRIVKSLIILLYFLVLANGGTIPSYDDIQQNEVTDEPSKPLKWLRGIQDVVSSPTGHVVVQVAKELLNRSAGNSQVLSLNVTNLLIILLLKILIFSAGMLGAGHWSNYGYARSDDRFSLDLIKGEDYMITGFLAAQGGFDECLYAAACESPQIAYEYAKAAKALIEGIEKFQGTPVENRRYIELAVMVEEAAYNGLRGMPCNITLKCENIL